MSTPDSIRRRGTHRPAMRLMMILCGLASAGAGVAGAATLGDGAQDAAPKLAIRYAPQQLATDEGARALYRRLVSAAEEVCPGPVTGSHLLSTSALRCRDQAVASAVRQVNSERLAQVYSAAMKNRS
jgi:UrcA family protein